MKLASPAGATYSLRESGSGLLHKPQAWIAKPFAWVETASYCYQEFLAW